MPDPRLFGELPPQLITFIVAMVPIFELRGAVPLAMFALNLSAMEAFFWSVLGNALAGSIVVLLLGPVSDWLRRLRPFEVFFHWLFERTRRRHSKSFERYRNFALFLFVAIPLPMTGAWSGAAAAFVFGVGAKAAIPLISLGVLAAGVVVTLISAGAIRLGDLFF